MMLRFILLDEHTHRRHTPTHRSDISKFYWVIFAAARIISNWNLYFCRAPPSRLIRAIFFFLFFAAKVILYSKWSRRGWKVFLSVIQRWQFTNLQIILPNIPPVFPFSLIFHFNGAKYSTRFFFSNYNSLFKMANLREFSRAYIRNLKTLYDSIPEVWVKEEAERSLRVFSRIKYRSGC